MITKYFLYIILLLILFSCDRLSNDSNAPKELPIELINKLEFEEDYGKTQFYLNMYNGTDETIKSMVALITMINSENGDTIFKNREYKFNLKTNINGKPMSNSIYLIDLKKKLFVERDKGYHRGKYMKRIYNIEYEIVKIFGN